MSQTATERYGEYEVIDGTWQFDLEFYRRIGLDLTNLEDPSPEAAMPRLHRTAGYVIEAASNPRRSRAVQNKAIDLLSRARSTVFVLMTQARTGLDFENLHLEHPAVMEWVDRNAAKANPSRSGPADHLRNVDHIELSLVRPVMPEIDPAYFTIGSFANICRPESTPDGIEHLANQYALAHVGVSFDI